MIHLAQRVVQSLFQERYTEVEDEGTYNHDWNIANHARSSYQNTKGGCREEKSSETVVSAVRDEHFAVDVDKIVLYRISKGFRVLNEIWTHLDTPNKPRSSIGDAMCDEFSVEVEIILFRSNAQGGHIDRYMQDTEKG